MRKITFILLVTGLIPLASEAQSTYGKITPVGGVTASLGQELTFSYTNLAGATYYWSAYPSVSSIPSSSIVFTTGVDTRTVKVKFLEPMTAFLCVTRFKAGTQPAMECISFNVINCGALPTPASLTGPTPISSCGSYTYTSAVVTGATGYQWSGFVTGDKQTVDPEITVSGSDFRLGNNSLKVKALNECGGSGSYRTKTVVVNGIGSPTSVTGPDTVLLSGASTLTYSASTVAQAASYKWFGFASGEKTTTSPTVNVTESDFIQGLNTISVRAVDSCDVESVTAASINVVGITLGTPTAITGPSSISFCGNATYSTNSVAGAVRYVWSGFTTGDKVTTDPNVNVLWTDFGPGSSSTVTVVAQDGPGNSNGSVSHPVTISASPLLSIPAGNQNPDYCTSSVYSVSPYPGATEYVWSILQSGFSITTTTNSVTINAANWGSFGSPRTLTVFARSCVNSNVSSNTITPQITLSAISGPSTVGCSSSGNYSINAVCLASGYRWVVDGITTITTSPTINLSSSVYNGLVTVEVRAQVGAQLSNPVSRTVDFTCAFPFAVSAPNIPVISPNPSKDSFKVTDIQPAESRKEAQVRVLTQDGRLIKAYTTKETSLNVEDLSLDSGVYLIEIRSENKQDYRKLLIKK